MKVPSKISRAVAKQVLRTKKNSPSILFVAGTGGMIVSTVLACRATLKLEEVLQESEKVVEDIELAGRGQHPTIRAEKYTAADAVRDRRTHRIKTGLEIAKLYGPAILVGALSIAALTKSHNLMRQRNAQLTAAYVAVSEALNGYRKRVADEYGPEKERELYHGVVEGETTIMDKNGPKTIKTKSAGNGSPYARMFNKHNRNWNVDPMYNLLFLRGQEKWANDRLVRDGFLLLNDVYEALGMERTKAGMVVGWVYDKTGRNLEGDNYITFGVWDENSLDKFHDFLVGNEDEVLVDFNVDGPIYDRI